jgi:hypothetical protein
MVYLHLACNIPSLFLLLFLFLYFIILEMERWKEDLIVGNGL